MRIRSRRKTKYSKVVMKAFYNCFGVFWSLKDYAKSFCFNEHTNRIYSSIIYVSEFCPQIYIIVVRTSKNNFLIIDSYGRIKNIKSKSEVIDYCSYFFEVIYDGYKIFQSFKNFLL